MDNRLPYYMAYPMPLVFDDERASRRDLDYMKSLYPAAAKRLIPHIEDECDRLEYEGSIMYDEYPDQLQLRLMCGRIYDRASQEEESPGQWLKDLIQVMAYQELCRRRSEHRSLRKKYY